MTFAAFTLTSMLTLTANPCDTLTMPPETVCLRVEQHLLIVDATDAAQAQADVRAANFRFKKHFSQNAPATLVSTLTLEQADKLRLAKNGFDVQLPWLSSKALLQQLGPALGMLDETTKAATIERFKSAKALTHELGHVWLMKAYWNEAMGAPGAEPIATTPAQVEKRYGSLGPDWMDELAAVGNESDKLTASRRKHFAELVGTKQIPDLDVWLRIEHPVFAQSKSLMPSVSGVRVLTGAEAEKLLSQSKTLMSPVTYYSLARAVIDFIDATARNAPYDSLARHIASGKHFDTWLKSHGKRFGLPASQVEFKAQFEAWADKSRESGTAN